MLPLDVGLEKIWNRLKEGWLNRRARSGSAIYLRHLEKPEEKDWAKWAEDRLREYDRWFYGVAYNLPTIRALAGLPIMPKPKRLSPELKVTIFGIIAIVGLEAYALFQGVDGAMFGSAMAAIGVLIGRAWKKNGG